MLRQEATGRQQTACCADRTVRGGLKGKKGSATFEGSSGTGPETSFCVENAGRRNL